MVDSLRRHPPEALRRQPWKRYGMDEGGYTLLTLHRPSNVDNEVRLDELVGLASRIADRMPVIFPVHPRTLERLAKIGTNAPKSLIFLEPLPYIAFVGLMARAKLVLTDSGGIQEETTALHVPCLTLRMNTERPSTVELGTNELVGEDLVLAERLVDRIERGEWKKGVIPVMGWLRVRACRRCD
ncbi:MAG: UDP-N-acetylglucosamine 2-epimerase [Bryobacteraceae bacterium]|jgi:UDP-N-acetylglucosamine 2-epimerase (non-hydrolysing)